MQGSTRRKTSTQPDSSNPDNPSGVAFLLCHPFHRGGVTRWMADAAIQWASTGVDCWFIVPEPTQVRAHSGQADDGRPPTRGRMGVTLRLGTIQVGKLFEFGTASYRAMCTRTFLPETCQRAFPLLCQTIEQCGRGPQRLQNVIQLSSATAACPSSTCPLPATSPWCTMRLASRCATTARSIIASSCVSSSSG